jgi:hypothetical protein
MQTRTPRRHLGKLEAVCDAREQPQAQTRARAIDAGAHPDPLIADGHLQHAPADPRLDRDVPRIVVADVGVNHGVADGLRHSQRDR